MRSFLPAELGAHAGGGEMELLRFAEMAGCGNAGEASGVAGGGFGGGGCGHCSCCIRPKIRRELYHRCEWFSRAKYMETP